MADSKFDTKALHAGYDNIEGGNIFPPIHMGVAYPFPDGQTAESICAGDMPGHIYARIDNPTNVIFEKRLASLEGGDACLATASGLAAIFLTLLGLFQEPGDEFVTSSRLYGNSQSQFRSTLPLMNFGVHWVENPSDMSAWEAMITDKTRLLFVETPSNPDLFVADLVGLAKVARDHDIALVVDSTLSTPAVLRPLELGADVVVHSTTKYLAGHAAALGGAIIGGEEFMQELRVGHHHYIGPSMSAFNAWLTILGLETLGVRMQRVLDNAQQIAEFLDAHPQVESVNFPGLKSHPQYDIAQDQMGGGGTSLLSFVVKGGKEGAWSVIDNLKIPCHATHLGGNQTIVVHPATTTHSGLTPEQREATQVPDGLIRFSVGLEDADDLMTDLDQALTRS